MKDNKELVILAGKGGGGSVTPASVLSAMEGMDLSQQADARAAIGATDTTTGLADSIKQALLNCFDHVAWTDEHGQDYVDSLTLAMYPLDHITAVYTQSGTVYDTDSLDSLKADLVVTAVYESGNTETVDADDYTLSGTMTAGTSTITVSYGGKTTTFTASITSYKDRMSYSMSSGLITKLTGTFGSDTTHGYYISTGNTKRRAFVFDVGETKLKTTNDESTFVDSPYYPIPIPDSATQVSVAIAPNTQFFAPIELAYADDKYTQVANPGWKQGSYSGALQAGQNRFFLVNSKYNSAGTSYPTEPSELTITFS